MADPDDFACHHDHYIIAGAGGVAVLAEDEPIHFPLACEADEFDLALEQACATSQVDGLVEGLSLG